MENGYRCSLGDINRTSDSEKLGWLSTAVASIGFATQYTKQTSAWQAEIELLGRLTTRLLAAIPQSSDWWLLLNYEDPRRGNRPDAILLAEDLIFVIEFKIAQNRIFGRCGMASDQLRIGPPRLPSRESESDHSADSCGYWSIA